MPNSNDFNRFSVNPVNLDISRSLFNMNHSVKFSTDIGNVVPFDVIEVVPGDTFSIDTSKVIRLQPLVAPMFDEIILDTYWFFVPYRLVWNHFVNMMGENTESAWTPETEYTVPKIVPPEGGFAVGSIADYMGIPPLVEGNDVSALPFRAYALICDQWFRSESVMDPVHVHVDDVNRTGVTTGDQVTDIELGGMPFIACKFFDYFTACLPSPQRGDPVSFQLLSSVGKLPVLSLRNDSSYNNPHPYNAGNTHKAEDYPVHITYNDSPGAGTYTDVAGAGFNVVSRGDIDRPSTLGLHGADPTSTGTTHNVYFDNLFVDLSTATGNAVTVNDLRTAFAIQKFLEKSARFGGRYISFIKGFFGVDSPDARLQRSEYLGGSRISLNINSVEQTSATQSGSTPLGNVAGMSVTADRNSDFSKSFTEFGVIIGCAVLRYHHSYQQSLHRMWTRESKYEFYNPVFANLGEQAVKSQELDYAYTTGTFGYQERWAEYRYLPSRIAGELRTVSPTPLDMWHLGDYYTSRPYLSADWLREDKTNLDRCLAVTSDVANQCLLDFYILCEASRPMPLYSIPGLIDHH